LELNLLTQGQIGTGNFHTASMLNKIQPGQTASSLMQALTPIHMAQQISGKPNNGVIFDSEANPMTTMYMGGAFDNLNLNTGIFGKK
jgi:hypothetical protein